MELACIVSYNLPFLLSSLCDSEPCGIFFVPNQQLAAALPLELGPRGSSVAATSL